MDCDGVCRAWAALRGFLDMNIMYNVQVQRGDGDGDGVYFPLLVCFFACLLLCLFASLLVCFFACLLLCLFALLGVPKLNQAGIPRTPKSISRPF
jgi:hypothetical protein